MIRLSLYPARVTSSDPDTPNFAKHKVIVTEDQFYVYTEPNILVHQEPLTSFTGSHLKGYTVNGTTTVQRAAGCPCGSALISFNPFPMDRLASMKEKYLEPATTTDERTSDEEIDTLDTTGQDSRDS